MVILLYFISKSVRALLYANSMKPLFLTKKVLSNDHCTPFITDALQFLTTK